MDFMGHPQVYDCNKSLLSNDSVMLNALSPKPVKFWVKRFHWCHRMIDRAGGRGGVCYRQRLGGWGRGQRVFLWVGIILTLEIATCSSAATICTIIHFV